MEKRDQLLDINQIAIQHNGESLGLDETKGRKGKWNRYFFPQNSDINHFVHALTFASLGKAVTTKGNICSVLI